MLVYIRAAMALFVAAIAAAPSATAQRGGDGGATPSKMKWVLHSSTVAQTLTEVEEQPSSLLTTYYQVEGTWDMLPNLGLHFEVEGGRVIGDEQTRSLGASLGSAYKLNDMQEGTELNNSTFYLIGQIPSANLRWKLGKVGQEEFFDDNRAARSKRRKFLALPFTRNPAVPFAGKGLGGALMWTPSEHTALTLSASDANAKGTKSGFTTWQGEWFTGAEVTVRPYMRPEKAAVRMLAWRTERSGVEDSGWGVSADHEIGPHLVAFVRVGAGSQHFARVRRFTGGGIAWEAPWGRSQDFFGIGVSRGEPLVEGWRTEILAEAIYRWQVTAHLALSPDVQFIHHPAKSNAEDAFAFGLRIALSN